MEVLPTPQPRNRQVPTGGVHKPMHKFVIIMIPKWTGCMSSPIATGKNIGVKINTAGVMSIKVPTNNKSRFIIARITKGLSDKPSIAELTVCGIIK